MAKTHEVVQLTIGGRTYELVPYLKEGESSVTGDTMVERAQEFNANLGEEDGRFILKHQTEIPEEFRGKFYLVFTAWRIPSNPQSVACLYWVGYRWCQFWDGLEVDWDEGDRLVRRVS